jgi:hypothetical protein
MRSRSSLGPRFFAVLRFLLRECIEAEDRPYFATSEAVSTSTRETWLTAKLNSLTKSTNSGWQYLIDGTRVFYRYKGENERELHNLFGSYDGLVRVRCVAHLDDSLKVVTVDVLDIERVQGHLFYDIPKPGPDDEKD